MKTKGKLLLVSFLVIILMSSCAAPVAVSTPTPIHTPSSTPTPTMTPTPLLTSTLTVTVTPTPAPAYTRVGIQANIVADTLGWELIACDHESEDIANFLYREDNNTQFCNFEGHQQEPVINVRPQHLLALVVYYGYEPRFANMEMNFALLTMKTTYYASPSTYNKDELSIIFIGQSYEEQFKYRAAMPFLRAWPLTVEEFYLLKSTGGLAYYELY